jgi:uncharacterized protein YicC (UPF0701 family)
MIKPEQMSLAAHSHIQKILNDETLTAEDLNAVYQLSQHLRTFGLLSAVGYINQSQDKDEAKVRARTLPIWQSLLAQLLNQREDIGAKELMDTVIKYANNRPDIYMLQWRRSLELSQHWNFWARAYKSEI